MMFIAMMIRLDTTGQAIIQRNRMLNGGDFVESEFCIFVCVTIRIRIIEYTDKSDKILG